jgi:hypothetical protein
MDSNAFEPCENTLPQPSLGFGRRGEPGPTPDKSPHNLHFPMFHGPENITLSDAGA